MPGTSFSIILEKVRSWLSRLSFRTGVIVLVLCVILHVAAFVPLAFDLSAQFKAIWWFWCFGAAKATQYTGLAIVGAEGVKRLRRYFKKKKEKDDEE